MPPHYFHIVIRGIPPGNDKDEVEKHITDLMVVKPPPFVYQVVSDPQTSSYSTTVSFWITGNVTGEYIKRNLHLSQFRSLPQQIHVDSQFYGLTSLADEPDATLDFCFVHGLGGHAFNSWTGLESRSTHRMWPRDFLPERFKQEGIRARFLTYGHNSNVFKHANPQATINTAAQQLLSHFIADRTTNPHRPVYFVCHSLGGLIVCEALVNCLCTDPGYRLRDDYKSLFDNSGECLVKGIVFFGTPFRGSAQANYTYPFIKALAKQCLWPVNENLVRSLKGRSMALNQFIPRFDRIRREQNIRLLICYETDPIIGTSLTTNRESALGTFDRDIAPIEINTNHTDMIRFSHRGDTTYGTIESRIISMVRSQLAQGQPNIEEFDGVSRIGTDQIRPPSYQSFDEHRGAQTNAQGPHEQRGLPDRTNSGHLNRHSNGFARSTHHDRHGSDSPIGQASRSIVRRSTGLEPRPTYSPIIRGSFVQEPAPVDDMSGLDRERFMVLADYDTVFVIDDSGSMQKPTDSTEPNPPDRWSSMQQGLKKYAAVAAEYDDDGIDIYMLKHNVKRRLKTANTVQSLLQSVNISDPISGGGTKFTPHPYPPNQHPKPLNLIVVTDGEADDEAELESFLVETAMKLEGLQAPRNFVGVQFVQVGDDIEASAYLKGLDDDLNSNYRNDQGNPIWDIVDTVRYKYDAENDSEREIDFVKVLLGGILAWVDNQGDGSSSDAEGGAISD